LISTLHEQQENREWVLACGKALHCILRSGPGAFDLVASCAGQGITLRECVCSRWVPGIQSFEPIQQRQCLIPEPSGMCS